MTLADLRVTPKVFLCRVCPPEEPRHWLISHPYIAGGLTARDTWAAAIDRALEIRREQLARYGVTPR